MRMLKRYTPIFIAALFTTVEIWNRRKGQLMDKQITQVCYIYTMEYYSTMRKKEILSFAIIWVDFKNIMLSEMSEQQKIIYDITYLYNIKGGIWKKQGNIGQRAQTSNFKTNEF